MPLTTLSSLSSFPFNDTQKNHVTSNPINWRGLSSPYRRTQNWRIRSSSEENTSNSNGSGDLKESLCGFVGNKVEELLSREENKSMLDGLEKSSMRVEIAKRELAKIERQELEAKLLHDYVNKLESRAGEIHPAKTRRSSVCDYEMLQAEKSDLLIKYNEIFVKQRETLRELYGVKSLHSRNSLKHDGERERLLKTNTRPLWLHLTTKLFIIVNVILIANIFILQ